MIISFKVSNSHFDQKKNHLRAKLLDNGRKDPSIQKGGLINLLTGEAKSNFKNHSSWIHS